LQTNQNRSSTHAGNADQQWRTQCWALPYEIELPDDRIETHHGTILPRDGMRIFRYENEYKLLVEQNI